MSRWQISVQVDEGLEDRIDEGWVASLVEMTLAAEVVVDGAEVSVVVTGDETIRELNRTYRGFDEATDVLSFALTEELETETEEEEGAFQFVLPPGMMQLGEVVISYETAERQAAERGLPVERELALLIVHGVLHLLGYDHAEEAEADVMRAKEQAILSKV